MAWHGMPRREAGTTLAVEKAMVLLRSVAVGRVAHRRLMPRKEGCAAAARRHQGSRATASPYSLRSVVFIA